MKPSQPNEAPRLKRLPSRNHPQVEQWTLGQHLAVCPIALTASLLVGRWKTNVLWLVWKGTNRFNNLHRSLPHANRGVLLRALRDLEADGLLVRTEHGRRPAPVEYALTPRALSLGPLLAQMAEWGRANGAPPA